MNAKPDKLEGEVGKQGVGGIMVELNHYLTLEQL